MPPTDKFNSFTESFQSTTARLSPTHRSLMGDAPEAIEGQAKLFRVLVAYAIYNPWIGYSQERLSPTHRSLMGDAPEAIEGQAKLFRVLVAYAIYNPWIGYSQGLTLGSTKA
ncbi:UNVERIFIED_CONTAM: hypothetical protein FKN15_011314 [Acipenser sinensis]